jgi:hypothetical protein
VLERGRSRRIGYLTRRLRKPEKLELRVLGKGNQKRVVPLPPELLQVLQNCLRLEREQAERAARAFALQVRGARFGLGALHIELLNLRDKAHEQLKANADHETAWETLAYGYEELPRVRVEHGGEAWRVPTLTCPLRLGRIHLHASAPDSTMEAWYGRLSGKANSSEIPMHCCKLVFLACVWLRYVDRPCESPRESPGKQLRGWVERVYGRCRNSAGHSRVLSVSRR